jgi:hypothetical protein
MTACFTSARIAGKCSSCKAASVMVHCPKKLKGIFCESCCPVCSPQASLAPSQAKELAAHV